MTQGFEYAKKHGYKTEVMGASFRTKEQVMALCGSDLLTISPDLLSQLGSSDAEVPKRLDADAAADMDIDRISLDEAASPDTVAAKAIWPAFSISTSVLNTIKKGDGFLMKIIRLSSMFD